MTHPTPPAAASDFALAQAFRERLAEIMAPDHVTYSPEMVALNAIRHRALKIQSAQPSGEMVSVQQAWEWAGGNPGIKATLADLETALRDLDAVCDEADDAPPIAQQGGVEECEVCRIFGDSNLLRKSATPVNSVDDEMVVRALDALSPEAVTNRYGYRKGYRVRDVLALDDFEATEVIRAILTAALAAQPAPGVGGLVPYAVAKQILADACDAARNGDCWGAFAEKLHAATRPAESVEQCGTCNGHGMIGGHTGQTPENFDQWEAPCPECNPVAESVAQGGENARDARIYSAALARAIPHLPTQSLRDEFAEILNTPTPATGSGGEDVKYRVLQCPNCPTSVETKSTDEFVPCIRCGAYMEEDTTAKARPAPPYGDALLLDSGKIAIAGRDEFGEKMTTLHSGVNLRAAIQAAIDYDSPTPAGGDAGERK